MWSTLTPAGSEKLVRGDDRIREWKQDLEYALTEEHNFPIVNNSPVATHKFPFGDEATKPLPTATSNRLFIHTAKNSIQFESGGAWADIASCFSSGTRMIFANLSAIAGWHRVVIDEKLLKVKGGDTNEGGSWTVSGYSSDEKDMPHTHGDVYLSVSEQIGASWNNVKSQDDGNYDMIGTKPNAHYVHTHTLSSCSQVGTTSLWHTHEITGGDWKLKYFVCVVCEKD